MVNAGTTRLHCHQGEFQLQRYPRRNPEPLQAWCGADRLLLDAISSSGETLVVNDEHGALSVALQPRAVWTDSALSAQAMRENCERNRRAMPALVWSTEQPRGPFDRVVVRIPKQLAYFEYQLAQLANHIAPGTELYFAGMDKHLSPHTAQIIERYFGAVERHRGQRKARLFTALQGASGRPVTGNFYSHYHCPHLKAKLCALPNVFSREQLDIGSRLLLDNLARVRPATQVADLACGNGVLGIAALKQELATEVTFIDESAMAVASTRANCTRVLETEGSATFHHGDGLIAIGKRFDLILCNPPFHLSHAVDDFAGRRLLRQCAQSLQPGGKLVLVANSHLAYGKTLQQSFSDVEQLARNDKFIVWQAHSSCQVGEGQLC